MTIHSPNGKFSIEKLDDYGEIGMGSPAFGHVTIHGTEGQLPDRMYGESVIFSPDSRFVALEELVEDTRLRSKLVVVELPRCKICNISPQGSGTATPLRWDSPARLIYTSWAVGSPRESLEWNAPAASLPRKKGLFG